MKKFLILLPLLVIFWGCSSTLEVNLMSTNSKTLNGYKNVLITENMNKEWKLPRVEITSMFESNGFRVVNEKDYFNLSREERLATIICMPNFYLVHFSVDTDYGQMSSLTYYLNLELENIASEQLLNIDGKADSKNLNEMYKQMSDIISQHYYGYNPSQLINLKKIYTNIIEVDLQKEDLIEYYDNNKINEIEGIWTESENNQYTIGIFRDTSYTDREYIGMILETSSFLWEPKQVKVELNSTSNKNIYSAYYYMSDHKIQGTTAYIDDMGYLNFDLTSSIDKQYFTNRWVKNYPPKIINKPKTPKNESYISSGSGTLITNTGIIITNYHIISDAADIVVCFPKINRQYSAKLILKDINNDIAFLKIDNFYYEDIFKTPIPFTIQYSNIMKISDAVYTMGYPLGDILGEFVKYSSGSINSLMGINGDPRTFLISNPVQPGNSGGPLFNTNGELIGIVMSSLNAELFFDAAGIIPQNVNFAIKSDYLLNIIPLLSQDDKVLTRDNLIYDKTLKEQVNQIEPFIVRILCK